MSDLPVARVGWLGTSWDDVARRLSVHFMPLYKLAVVFFALSTLLDTGSADRKGVAGLSLTMVMMILVTALGLLLWRAPRDGVVVGCMVLIGLWVWGQLLSGQSWRAGIIVTSVLALALVVGGVKWSHSLFWYQMRWAAVAPFIAGVAFYLGFWHTMWTGRQSFLEFNPNQLAFNLSVGFVLGLALMFRVKRPFRGLMLVSTLLFLPAIWATGSRAGLAMAVMAGALFLVIRSGRSVRALFSLGAVSLAGLLIVYQLDVFSSDWLAGSAVAERFSPTQLEAGQALRLGLLLSGLGAFLQKPWLGHGMGAPWSIQWLAENMTYANLDMGVATHNGFVDYLIMGGVPLGAVYLILHLRVGGRLWRASRSAGGHSRDAVVLAFCLFLLHVGVVLKGDPLGKLSWWLLGIGLQTISRPAASREEEASS